jgi:hypothetical protein
MCQDLQLVPPQPWYHQQQTRTDSIITIMDCGHAKSLHLHILASELRNVLSDISDDFNKLAFWSDLGFDPQDDDMNTLPVIVLLPKILLPSNKFPYNANTILSNLNTIRNLSEDMKKPGQQNF